jgi:hypothetical protein
MQSAVQDPPAPIPASPPAGDTLKHKPSKRRTMVGQYEVLPQDQQRQQQQQQQQWGGSIMQAPPASPRAQQQHRQHSPTLWAGGSVAGMPPASSSPHHARGNTIVAAQSPLVYDAVDAQQHEAYNALSLKPTSQPVLSMRERGDPRQQRSAPDLTYQPMAQQPLKYVELAPEKQLRYGGLAPEQPAAQTELWPDEMDSVPNTPMRVDSHPMYGELGVEPAHPRQYGELGPERPMRYGELRPEIDHAGEREPQAYGEMPVRPQESGDQEAYLQVPEIDNGGGELYDQVPTRKMVASPGGRSKNRAMAAGNNQFR